MSILDNKYCTVTEVARLLRVDQSTIRRKLKEGAIEYIELPGRSSRKVKRIPEQALARLLKPACPRTTNEKLPA